ncbi:unnamed protein product [Somion occarium]|uniref:NAD(P)-binding protein n=1 Tax=Somion occarium TaxID=3059160 RepID=A0ABP1DXZ7_9APHY
MSLPLVNKVAIVTGASKGIGAAIAKRLAADGATVVINYVNSADVADELANSINAQGPGKAIAIKADVSKIEGGKKLLEDAIEIFGQLDILVFNAGLMKNEVLANVSEKDFDDHIDINVKVPLFVTQSAARFLKPGARVMFFSTALTLNSAPPPNYLLYLTSKGAVEHVVRVLAKDLGAKGITVNAICPGPTDTDLFREGKTEQLIQFFANMHPQKRIPSPDEIAPIVAFLARDEAGWINGQKLYVNGGFNV